MGWLNVLDGIIRLLTINVVKRGLGVSECCGSKNTSLRASICGANFFPLLYSPFLVSSSVDFHA